MIKHLPLLGHRMTRIFPILLFIGLAWGQNQYDVKHIIEQGGVYKKKFSDEVVNGEVFQMFGDMKVPLGKIKQGKKEGVWIVWNEDGTKKMQTNYSKGKMFGVRIAFDKNGKKEIESNITDSLNYSAIRYFQDGSIMTNGRVVNGIPYEGTFYTIKKASVDLRKDLIDYRKTVSTYNDGKLIKIEWFEDSDLNNKKIIKVDDCLKTDDCLTENEKKLKNTISTKPELVWESGFLGLNYFTKKYRGTTEVFLQLNNTGSYPYKSVWLRIDFYREGNLIYDERVQFMHLKASSQVLEKIELLDEFDKIDVELLKFTDG